MAGIGDFMGLMGKVKDIQANMQRIQEEQRSKIFEAASGGGMVVAKINGKNELLELKIDPETVDPNDIEMLEDLIKAAINTANDKCQDELKNQFSEMTGSMNIPGLENIGKLLGMG